VPSKLSGKNGIQIKQLINRSSE